MTGKNFTLDIAKDAQNNRLMLLLFLFFAWVFTVNAQVIGGNAQLSASLQYKVLSDANTQSDSVLSLKARWDSGPTKCIAAARGKIFINNGSRLVTLLPGTDGRLYSANQISLNFLPVQMIAANNILIVRGFSGHLKIFDISNNEPQLSAELHLGEQSIFDWALAEDKLLLARADGFMLIDLQASDRPEILFDNTQVFEQECRTVAFGGAGFFAGSSNQLNYYKFEKTSSPEIIAEYHELENLRDIQWYADFLIIAAGNQLSTLRVESTGDLQRRNFINCNWAGPEIKLTKFENQIFAMNRGEELVVFQVNTQGDLSETTHLPAPLQDLVATETGLVVAEADRCLRLNDALLLENIYRNDFPQAKMQISENALYFSAADQLMRLQLGDAGYPRFDDQFLMKHSATNYHIIDQYIYSISNDSLIVRNWNEGQNADILFFQHIPKGYWEMLQVGNFLYLSNYQEGLLAFDVANADNPFLIGDFPEIKLGKIKKFGNYLFGENVTSLEIFSIVDPRNPEYFNSYAVSGFIRDFVIHQGIALISVDDSGLWFVDFSNPQSPEYLNWIPGRFDLLEIQGNYLITTPGLKIYDISDMHFPVLKQKYSFSDLNGRVEQILVRDADIIVKEDNLGIFLFQNKLAQKETVEEPISFNYPNPFNSTTTISYHVKDAGRVTIDIYDLHGHHVKNLRDEVQADGDYYVSWDASNTLGRPVASGVYLYRVAVGKKIESRKILLIR